MRPIVGRALLVCSFCIFFYRHGKCFNLCLPPSTFHCHLSGIFLSNDLWHNELLKGKNFEFKIWSLPSIETVKARKVAHLLNELPLPASQRNASVELRADSLNRTTQFQSILKAENLCFETSSAHEKLLVYVGDAAFMNSVSFGASGSLIVIPLSMKGFVMAGE